MNNIRYNNLNRNPSYALQSTPLIVPPLDTSRYVLMNSRVSFITSQKYIRAADYFIQYYLSNVNINLQLINNYCYIDSQLAHFITQYYLQGGSRAFGNQIFFGLIYCFPRLKTKLIESRAVINGWAAQITTKSHPPIPWDIVCLMAIHMSNRGLYEYSLATLLAFDCYLRVNELCSITIEQFGNSNSVGNQSNIYYIGLPYTKTGPHKHVTVNRIEIAIAIAEWIKIKSNYMLNFDNNKLFSFSARQYRKEFKFTCICLGLHSIKFAQTGQFVPHSLRHGGAVHDFICKQSLESILLRGRWKSTDSARTYIKDGLAIEIQSKLRQLNLPILKSYSIDFIINLLWKCYLHYRNTNQ